VAAGVRRNWPFSRQEINRLNRPQPLDPAFATARDWDFREAKKVHRQALKPCSGAPLGFQVAGAEIARIELGHISPPMRSSAAA
jgi:hypothetical protein